MAMEVELDPRHAILPFKVRAVSKEAQPHKAAHVLDPDPKSHWSTSTNAKEWLLLELEEPCLLQQIRIHNKSVLEWEIAFGLRYKPESFSKVRTRSEAPRRDSQILANYSPCRYVRISCLRGNPIALYSVQLIGISVPGLEPEFQPLVDHLLPYVTSNKLESSDLYLQLLREIVIRLTLCIAYLETDLLAYNENMEGTLRFLAMLAGPFYPILLAINRWERMKNLAAANDFDLTKGAQISLFTVSSNFQAPPRRSRSPVPAQQSGGQLIAFRRDFAFLLLRACYKDNMLGTVCRMVARVFGRILSATASVETNVVSSDVLPGTLMPMGDDVATIGEMEYSSLQQTDYSSIFGDDFRVLEDSGGDPMLSPLLDTSNVEEGLLHFLYASTSKPILCRRLAEVKPDLMPILPFIQAILPALRPAAMGFLDQPEENFTPWQAPLVQRAFSQVVGLATTPSYGPLLDACAGYLMSFSIAHEKAACVIIDLCSGPLAPWLPIVVAKVDLTFELVEGILSSFQVVVDKGISYARAALVYVILGLSGHMDEVLPMYKAVKHAIIFVIEILEPFLLPAINPIKNTIAFGHVSMVLTEKQEHTCSLVLDILRAATRKPAALPALEMEWRKGTVKPSVLLHVLAPQLPMPPGIDGQECAPENVDKNSLLQDSENGGDICLPNGQYSGVTKVLVAEEEVTMKMDSWVADNLEDPCFLFAPVELKLVNWKMFLSPSQDNQEFGQFAVMGDSQQVGLDVKDNGTPDSSSYTHPREALLHADFLQLVQFQERELQAAEFVRLATELHSQEDGAGERRQAAIDCLLLAAECHLNPLTLQLLKSNQSLETHSMAGPVAKRNLTTMSRLLKEKVGTYKGSPKDAGLSKLFNLEEDRDRVVLQILLKAAEWDTEFRRKSYEDLNLSPTSEDVGNSVTKDSLMDATTLVREHENLICRFLVLQLQREGNIVYEALLQGLIFFLVAATELSCSPELILDIILMSARQLNVSLLSHHEQLKAAKHQGQVSLNTLTLHRTWLLLCRLLAAASGGESLHDDDEMEFCFTGSACQDLVPASAWVNKVADFASSPFPLVRYIGWKGLARFGKSQQQSGLLLASDLQQLSLLLSVFADDFMSSGREDVSKLEHEVIEQQPSEGLNPLPGNTIDFLYPELDHVCPNVRKDFHACAHTLLDAACLQLKGVPVTSLPDILSWFSELCQNPYVLEKNTNGCSKIKGFAAANIRFIILRLLEVILLEYMEAMVPELPRVFIVVFSLCQSPYCDISLLDSVLKALKPLISYGLKPAASAELQLEDDDSGTLTMEALCFDSLIEALRKGPEALNGSSLSGALLMFLAGAVLSDLTTARRLEVLHLLSKWANFASYSEVPSCYNYLCAFQKVLEACQWLLEKMLDQQGLSWRNVAGGSRVVVEEDWTAVVKEKVSVQDPEGVCGKEGDIQQKDITAYRSTTMGPPEFSVLEEFGSYMESLVFALGESLERAWKLHPGLTEKLTRAMAFCLMASNHLTQNLHGLSSMQDDTQGVQPESEERKGAYGTALDGFCRALLTFQQLHCWQVAACTMDFLLSWRHGAGFLDILPSLSSVLQFQCNHAPRVSWRQHVLKWLSNIITRVISDGSCVPIAPLTGLFKVLLEHQEPELRAGAIQQLERIADSEDHGLGSRDVVGPSELDQQTSVTNREKPATFDFVLGIVTVTWDTVCSLAACDPSHRIRRAAIKLLIKFVPIAQPHHLQNLLSSADTFLPGLAKDTYTLIDAPVTRLSLALLSRACLYSTIKEISTIPSRVWTSLEVLSRRWHGSILAEAERAMCIALLQSREQGEDAKEVIHEAFSRQTESGRQASIQFMAVQESVLQVLARINAIRMMEDSTSAERTREAMELEEAEIELEVIKQDITLQGKSEQSKSHLDLLPSETLKPKSRTERLEQLRALLLTEERSRLREEILARWERQKLAMRNRQLALEESALREIELLQELDREKTAEMEKDIERQRTLERERARTKELRHSLELDAEKRTQRDLQRELEQREAGSMRQSSRREFSGSTGGSRPRERYRERESGRTSQDTRSSAGGPRENSTTPPATPTAGSRTHGR